MTTRTGRCGNDKVPPLGTRVADWDAVTRLAWRPAWHIRSRRGTLALLISCWRNRRRGRVV